jgi:putative membrane protein
MTLMRTELKEFAQRWIISTVAVLVAARMLPGISYDHWTDLLVATLVLGILNSVLRPLLMLLSLPLLVLTLGLFTLLINAGLLYLVSLMLPGFHVRGFWSAFFGALIISLITLFLNSLTRSGGARVQVRRGRRPQPKPEDDDGQGPVIDV